MKNKTMKILSATVMMAIGTLGGATVSQAAVDSVIGDTYTIGATTEGNNVTLSAKTGEVSSGNKGLVTGETVSAYLHAEHMALGYGTKADGSAATAYGFSDDASGSESTAVGFSNKATNVFATAVGDENTASGEYSSAVGSGNTASGEQSSALGNSNTARGKYSSALGDHNTASGEYSTAVGSWNTAEGESSTALGLGNTASELQASAIGAFNKAEGGSSSAVGLNNTVSGEASASFGYNNTVSGDGTYVYGGSNEVAAKGALVLGKNVTTVADNSVVIGDGSTSEEGNTVSIGSEGNERKLVHVADGTDAHDAATVGQLNAVANNLNTNIAGVQTQLVKTIKGVQDNLVSNIKDVETMAKNGIDKANQKIDTNAGNIKQNQLDIAENKEAIEAEAAARADMDMALQKNIDAEAKTRENADEVLQQGIDAETANRVAADNALDSRISHVETDANKGIAKATALAALHPLDYDPDNKFDVAAAGGFYKGEKAFALGAFYRPNRNVMLSLATSLSSGDNAYNVGVTFKIGKAGKRSEAGVSTAELYAMIGAMQEKMDQQQKRIEELEANQAK